MKRVFALGLPLSLLTIAIGTSWAQEPIVPLQTLIKTLDARAAVPKPNLRSILLQPAQSTKQSSPSTEPIGQRIRYSGPFTNTTVNLSGNVVIDLTLEENDRISGYINFTNYPGVPSLCGAGNFTGYRQGRNLQFSFVSDDPEPDCGSNQGWNFIVTATLSEDYQTIENGAYQVDTAQGGIFRAVAEDLPIAQAASIPSTAGVILDIQDEIDRNSSVLPSDGSRYNEHTFQGQAGQEVTIRMQSRELDTYLILLGPDGNVVAQNDDASSLTINSEITVTLPQSGTYTVIANAYDSSGRGRYSLTVQNLSSETEAPVATIPPERSPSVTQPSSTSPTPSPAPLSPTVGTVECAGNNSDGTTYSNRRNMTSAILEPAGQGYTLRMVEEMGEQVFTLGQNLVIVSAATVEEQRLLPWNLVAYDGTPITVSRDGSFNISMRVSTRSGCTFQGQLTFQNGADVALFGTSETSESNDATSTITQTNSTTPLEPSQSVTQPSTTSSDSPPVSPSPSSPSSTSQSSLSCNESISAAQARLEGGRDLRVVQIQVRNISDYYDDYPTGRPDAYRFSIQGSAAPAVMNSPQMMIAISTEIIQACSTVSIVDIGVRYTDWGETYGLMSDGTVQAFECFFNDRHTDWSSFKLAWGSHHCL
jgi:hypothetical protein